MNTHAQLPTVDSRRPVCIQPRLNVAEAYREAELVLKMPELLSEPLFQVRAEVWRLHALWAKNRLDQCHLSLRKVASHLSAGVPLELTMLPVAATFFEVACRMWAKALKHASRYQVELGHAAGLGIRLLQGLAQSRPTAQLNADFARVFIWFIKGMVRRDGSCFVM